MPTLVPQGIIRGLKTGTHSSNLFDHPSYVPRSSFRIELGMSRYTLNAQ